jgi:DNA modification methylase
MLSRESVDIKLLQPAKYNPRRIDDSSMAALEKSIERFGMVQEIVCNRRNMRVIGGHQRLKILRAQKTKQVPVVFVDLEEHEEKALNVALNSEHLSGTFTDDLQAILAEIQGKDEVLFNELLLDQLLADVEQLGTQGDPEDIPDVPQVATTKLGDLYTLGNHRLYCGDSTDAASLAALLQGETVDSLVTDPPYGVDYGAKNALMNSLDGGARIEKKIDNDAIENYREWFASWLKLIPFSQKATFYIAMLGLTLHELRLALDDCGYHWGDYLVWVKNAPVFGRKDYHAKHEFILYGWPKTHRFFADQGSRNTVLEYDRPLKNDLHPTMKPVALIEQLVRDGSPSGGIVLDIFGGSGTTLIACEQSGRQARLIEIDPLYCDVSVKRWEDFTGKKAVLHASGTT